MLKTRSNKTWNGSISINDYYGIIYYSFNDIIIANVYICLILYMIHIHYYDQNFYLFICLFICLFPPPPPKITTTTNLNRLFLWQGERERREEKRWWSWSWWSIPSRLISSHILTYHLALHNKKYEVLLILWQLYAIIIIITIIIGMMMIATDLVSKWWDLLSGHLFFFLFSSSSSSSISCRSLSIPLFMISV